MCQTETTRSNESEQEEYLVEGSAGDGVSLDVGPDDDVPPSLGGKDRPGRIRVAGAIPVVGRRVLVGGRRHLSHQYVLVGERSEEEDRTCKGNFTPSFPKSAPTFGYSFSLYKWQFEVPGNVSRRPPTTASEIRRLSSRLESWPTNEFLY